MKRILFCAEGASLAHVGRAITLARSLPAADYDVALATDDRYRSFVDGAGLRWLPQPSAFGPGEFGALLRAMRPLFSRERLVRAVLSDVALLLRMRPHAVVGDFRPSLGISAELLGVPYLNVVNAYWSPQSTAPVPTPEHTLVDRLGARLGGALFRAGAPIASEIHAEPFRQLRRAYGLRPLTDGLRGAYTHATWTLYADAAELTSLSYLPSRHAFLGPVAWQPDSSFEWPDALSTSPLPLVYVSLGSTGDPKMIDPILDGLEGIATVLVATAGHPVRPRPHVVTRAYLPGALIAHRASLVICNGGSSSLYQALSAGTPVIGVPSNFDQVLATSMVVRKGCGRALRLGELRADRLRAMALEVLRDDAMRDRARALARVLGRYDAAKTFLRILETKVFDERQTKAQTQAADARREGAVA